MKIAWVLVPLLVLLVSCGEETNSAPTSVDFPGGYQGEDDITVVEAEPDAIGKWETLTVEGVSLDVPRSADWRVDIVRDPCSITLGRWILIENTSLGIRAKIDVERKTIDVESRNAAIAQAVEAAVDRLRSSLKGDRVISDEVSKFVPFPTTSACDPKAHGVPTLIPIPRDPVSEATVVEEPTITPVAAPSPGAP